GAAPRYAEILLDFRAVQDVNCFPQSPQAVGEALSERGLAGSAHAGQPDRKSAGIGAKIHGGSKLLQKSRRTILASFHSGKEYARMLLKSRISCDFGNFQLVKIAEQVVPGIEPRAVDAAVSNRDDQILHAGPERLVAAAQRHVLVFIGEIGAHLRMRM